MSDIGIFTTMQHPCNKDLGWGMESYVWDLAESLDKLGHFVTIFGTMGSEATDNGSLCICENEDDILKTDFGINLLKEYDIIHDFSSTKPIHDYCQQNNIKSIATNFNVHFLYPKMHKNLACVSDRQRYLGLRGRSGFEGTPWYQQVGYIGHLRDAKRVYLGINLDKYLPKYDKEDYILYFNSYDYRKGITIAINLAREMGFNLVVAGEMKGHPEHQETFKQLKPIMDSIPNIKYYTDVTNEEKIELMQNAKAFLFPSMFEQPFGVVVTQAMACGTPVIVTNHGAFPEQVIHNETGYLCNNIEEMKQAIRNIDKIDGRKCRADTEKRFDRILMAKEYIKLYENVINGDEW